MPTSPRIPQSITDSIAVKQAILNDSELLARIQERHILIGHILCELVETAMFGNK